MGRTLYYLTVLSVAALLWGIILFAGRVCNSALNRHGENPVIFSHFDGRVVQYSFKQAFAMNSI